MKYARFQDPKHDWFSAIYSEEQAKDTAMICISEWVEVDFPPLSDEVIMPAQIASLDRYIAGVTEKFGKELADLKTRRANLLALSDQRAVVE